MDGSADVAETTYTPFQTKPDAAPVRHCPAGEAGARFPARPLRQIQLSRLHHRPRWGDAGLEADHRRHARSRYATYGVGLNRCRRSFGQRRLAGGTGDGRDRWTARIGLGEQVVTTKTLRPASPWPDGSPARRAASLCISPAAGLGKPKSRSPAAILPGLCN